MIREREFLRSSRHRIALLAVLGALALAHSGIERSPIGSGEAGPVLSRCFAIAVVGGAMFGVLAGARVRRAERPPLTIARGPGAEAIIAAQSREIEQMNSWRERWYGAPSPAGGADDAGMAMPAHDREGALRWSDQRDERPSVGPAE